MPDFRKTLFVVRHAHRVVTDRSLDNGLSERGRIQAHAAALHIHKILGPKPATLKSSPRLRCIETLEPLAKLLGCSVEIDSALCEQERHETEAAFMKRIEAARDEWIQRGADRLIVCSHGDWIPNFCEMSFSQRVSLDKGGVIEAKLAGEKPVLFEVRQKLEGR